MNELENAKAGRYIEVADTSLVFRVVSISDNTPSGDQILAACDVSPRDEYVVLQWLPGGDIEEVRGDETVDIKGDEPSRFIVSKTDRLFRAVLNERSISWPDRKISAVTLRALGRIDPAASLYLRRDEEVDQQIDDDGTVSLGDGGVENFYSKREKWKLNVGGVMLEFDEPEVKVRDAIIKAGSDPDQGWIIVLKTADAKRQVSLDEIIDLRAPGIEKLRLIPREINNGEVMDEVLRRDFQLLPNDEAGLELRNLEWETLIEGGRRWFICNAYPLPPGYSASSFVLALEIPPAYPSAEIDMFYCWPPLACLHGRPIPQTEARVVIRSQSFQRWSRHRGAGAQWSPARDNVLTQLALVDAAILREVEP